MLVHSPYTTLSIYGTVPVRGDSMTFDPRWRETPDLPGEICDEEEMPMPPMVGGGDNDKEKRDGQVWIGADEIWQGDESEEG